MLNAEVTPKSQTREEREREVDENKFKEIRLLLL